MPYGRRGVWELLFCTKPLNNPRRKTMTTVITIIIIIITIGIIMTIIIVIIITCFFYTIWIDDLIFQNLTLH